VKLGGKYTCDKPVAAVVVVVAVPVYKHVDSVYKGHNNVLKCPLCTLFTGLSTVLCTASDKNDEVLLNHLRHIEGVVVQNKPRVLVVEDHPDIQITYQMALDHIADVVIVGSISAAMCEIQGEPRFALVILDGNVPRFEGEPLRPGDTTVMLASRIALLNIPMLSASGDDNLNNMLVSIGCIRADKMTAISKAKEFFHKLKHVA